MGAPLTVTLLTPRELSVLTLPETCGGQFYLTDHIRDDDGKSKLRKLVSIEGKSSGWIAKSTRYADVMDGAAKVVKSLDIKNNSAFFVNIKGEESVKYIAKCQSASTESRTFKKYYIEDNSVFSIGRSENCDIQIESTLVSFEHATLAFKHEKWVLCDLESTNGTYVNNERVSPEKDVLLKYGDSIYVIGVTLVVCNGFIAFNNPSGIVATSRKLLPLKVESHAVNRSEEEDQAESSSDFYYRSPRFMREIEE